MSLWLDLKNMQFRWVAGVALWTLLSGPVFNGKSSVFTPSSGLSKPGLVKTTPLGKRSGPNIHASAYLRKS